MYKGKKLFIIFTFLGLISCEPSGGQFFMRYKCNDSEKCEKDILDRIHDLEQTHEEYKVFIKSIDLSEKLTIAGREYEAIVLLKPYIENEIGNAAGEDLVWLYLNYATANQYARKSVTAAKYFKKACSLADERNLETVMHYAFHHYGRFLVEREEYDLAKQHFEKALYLRQRLADQRVSSTQKALDSLAIIMRQETIIRK